MKNITLALALSLPALSLSAKSLPDVPKDCLEDIQLKGFCADSEAPIFKGPVKVKFFIVVDKSTYPTIDSAVARYADFPAWPDYVAASGKTNVEFNTSVTLAPLPAKDGQPEIMRHYSNYRMKAPVVGWQDVRSVIHNYIVPAYDGALASLEFEVQNEGTQEVPVGEEPLEGSIGVSAQTGSVHVLSCEASELCSKDQQLLVYASTITPDIDILPSVAAGAILEAVEGIIIGMFLDTGAGDGEIL